MPIGQDELDLSALMGTRAGGTVQLGTDYLVYAREKLTPTQFKHELTTRLAPTVPRRGPPHPIRPGRDFGKFVVEERLGKGGMAEVFLANDPERGPGKAKGRYHRTPYVAIKVMKTEIAQNPDYVRRFLREAANTALIDHENVVQVHEVGAVMGRLYFSMEVIEGQTLKEHMRKGPVSEEEGIQILCQLVDGLQAAHDRGIGHRDLKPSNLMLLSNEARYGYGIQGEWDVQVKITDFGLAHMLNLDRSQEQGTFLGTAKYVAPEVVRGEKPTLKSDVFSLGILAFQMFAGSPPFRARGKMEYITANLQQEAPALHEVVPVSEDLSRLVGAMLGKDPVARPGAKTLRADLARLRTRAGREPIVVYDDPSSVFAVREEARSGGLPFAVAPQVPVLAAVGLSVLFLLGFLLTRGDDPPELPEPTPTPVAAATPTPRPIATPLPTATPTPDEGEPGLLDETPSPPGSAFRDQLARMEFSTAVREGDAAWKAGEPARALTHWETAAGLLAAPLPALTRRIAAARLEAALDAGLAAEQQGDMRRALREYEAAIRAGLDDPDLLAHRDRVAALVEREVALDRAIKRARAVGRTPARVDEAVRRLRELLPEARELGLGRLVEDALAELGASPEAPVEAEDPAGHLLAKAEELLSQRAWDAAELALRRAKPRTTDPARLQRLRARLDRARGVPDGWVYLELGPAAEGGLPPAIYARERLVTHAEYYTWFAEAAQRGALLPPRSWGPRGRPTPEEEHEPVQGVRREEATQFAADRGERLPQPDERAAIEAQLGRTLPPEPEGDFPQGFLTVRELEGR